MIKSIIDVGKVTADCEQLIAAIKEVQSAEMELRNTLM